MNRTANAERSRHRRAVAKATDPAAYKAAARQRHLAFRYGITHEQYEEMVVRQNGTCACCGTSDPGRDRWLVDHDHTTGTIRGLLCFNCNIGIGKLGDNVAGVQRALDYLMQRPFDQ